MKHKTVKTSPLKSDKIVITIPKPVIRRRFAPATRAHGNMDYKRIRREMRAIDRWCDEHFGKE